MTELVAILAAALLFAGFGLLQRRLGADARGRGCGAGERPADCGDCDRRSELCDARIE